ncbi:hypothetical protein UFOVP51_82 [uncultured Caudovirales phage]|uniref:Uncharacterized protein n=1 Tax=uncultured Caudovirales phage TaxID=2100421 RepID=A0A6J5KSL9_9CAUD|nr:hypothetical protein UFOVP51_82 [uncultured Caudovirales phage]CAB4240805.1 hypothetical protein UFOVP34_24 [uncultured Caudovirales phage]
MVDFFDKVVKYFSKLDDYYILRQEKEHLIIGTKIVIKEYKESEHTFSTFVQKIDKTIGVCFLITIAEKATPLDKLFIQQELPLLSINNKKGTGTFKDFREKLDNFVENNFYY